MKVLIAEDDEDARQLLSLLLKRKGWRVASAEDGREALYLYHESIHREKYFDLILLDVEMPRLNGFAVGVNVRNLEKFGGIPRAVIIFLTGKVDVVPSQELLDSSFADGYIHKPFSSKKLIGLISKLVEANNSAKEPIVDVESKENL